MIGKDLIKKVLDYTRLYLTLLLDTESEHSESEDELEEDQTDESEVEEPEVKSKKRKPNHPVPFHSETIDEYIKRYTTYVIYNIYYNNYIQDHVTTGKEF